MEKYSLNLLDDKQVKKINLAFSASTIEYTLNKEDSQKFSVPTDQVMVTGKEMEDPKRAYLVISSLNGRFEDIILRGDTFEETKKFKEALEDKIHRTKTIKRNSTNKIVVKLDQISTSKANTESRFKAIARKVLDIKQFMKQEAPEIKSIMPKNLKSVVSNQKQLSKETIDYIFKLRYFTVNQGNSTIQTSDLHSFNLKTIKLDSPENQSSLTRIIQKAYSESNSTLPLLVFLLLFLFIMNLNKYIVLLGTLLFFILLNIYMKGLKSLNFNNLIPANPDTKLEEYKNQEPSIEYFIKASTILDLNILTCYNYLTNPEHYPVWRKNLTRIEDNGKYSLSFGHNGISYDLDSLHIEVSYSDNMIIIGEFQSNKILNLYVLESNRNDLYNKTKLFIYSKVKNVLPDFYFDSILENVSNFSKFIHFEALSQYHFYGQEIRNVFDNELNQYLNGDFTAQDYEEEQFYDRIKSAIDHNKGKLLKSGRALDIDYEFLSDDSNFEYVNGRLVVYDDERNIQIVKEKVELETSLAKAIEKLKNPLVRKEILNACQFEVYYEKNNLSILYVHNEKLKIDLVVCENHLESAASSKFVMSSIKVLQRRKGVKRVEIKSGGYIANSINESSTSVEFWLEFQGDNSIREDDLALLSDLKKLL